MPSYIKTKNKLNLYTTKPINIISQTKEVDKLLSNPYKRLIKHGFYNSNGKSKFSDLTPSEREEKLINMSNDEAKKLADVEYSEEFWKVITTTDYPIPLKKFWITYEAPNHNPEEAYYWFHHQISVEQSMEISKIIDTYAASEGSSFFGMMQQRLSIQQGNVSNFLKGISEMVKGLFQIVREIRIINDRLQYYKDTYEKNENTDSSEIVLKGLWVDQVEGGTKNPGSVYGLSSQVGFTILPDLFFRIKMSGPKEVDKIVDKLQFNEKVKEVLKRKLRQYYEWKERTYSELETRRKFQLKYLRQHYETIKLYTSWIKPYLRYINRMQQTERHEMTPEIIKSFEGAFVEIEIMGKKKGKGKYNQVFILNLQHRTRPETNIHQPQDYGQKGPLHIGRSHIRLRAYIWTNDDIKNYMNYRQEEDIAILSAIDSSIKEAVDSLGDELKAYLGMEGEKFSKEKKINELATSLVENKISKNIDDAVKKAKEMIESKKEKSKPSGPLDPFTSIFKGFGDIFGITEIKIKKSGKKSKLDKYKDEKDYKDTLDGFVKKTYATYKNYKKAHKMLTW